MNRGRETGEIPMDNRKILIIAGESSGDRHAADLIRKISETDPSIRFFGIGGDEMSASGMQLLFHIRDMAFLGLTEVLRHLPFIRKVFQILVRWVENEHPTAVILVDYPGFNLRLARMMKKRNIPVIYYICPQLWAWGQRRVEKIRRYVDLPLVIFKFEEEFYTSHGIKSVFVGHPLLDEIHITLTEGEFRGKYRLKSDKPIIGLLPGSRINELSQLLPAMAEAAAVLNHHTPMEWLLARSTALPIEFYQNILKPYPFIRIIENDTHHIMRHSRVVVVSSGTATLETGFLGTPMVVLYRVSPVTYHIGKHLIRIPNIALANIVLQARTVPELIQDDVHPTNIIRELNRFLQDESYHAVISQTLARIPALLGKEGASQRAAEEILKFIKQ